MKYDAIIVGGGFAGASVVYFLSRKAKVLLLEREAAPATQSSGRSAEQYTVGITADLMRAMAVASRSFLDAPPPGFCERPLLSPRGSLTVGRGDQRQRLQALADRITGSGAEARIVGRKESLDLFPALRAGGVDLGVFEPGASDIDGGLLLQSYLRGAKANGAEVLTDAAAESIRWTGRHWAVTTMKGEFSGSLLINAAGAWVDVVAGLAGVSPLGIRPMRRTAFTFPARYGVSVANWPHVCNVDYRWYLKPESSTFMGSLAEEVLVAPGDVYPDDLDVAQGVDNIERETTLNVSRLISSWAGLRNFVGDRNPVLGRAPDRPEFIWVAGQGGCGVLTSPAMGESVAAIATGSRLPLEVLERGVTEQALSPGRLG